MHNARIETSDRLQRVYRALQRGPKTTRDLIHETGCCAINSIVSELRACGIPVGKPERIRQGVYLYRLEKLF